MSIVRNLPRSRLVVATVLCQLCMVSTSLGRTWRVERDGSGDYSTIQPAIENSAPGDTILIGPGRYTETTIFPWSLAGDTGPVYAGVGVDNLTIRGSDRDGVILGPDVPNFSNFHPKGISHDPRVVSSLYVENLTVQNVAEGIRPPGNSLTQEILAIGCGVGFAGTYGVPQLHDSQFVGSTDVGVVFLLTSGAVVRDCRFQDALFADSIGILQSTDVLVRNCTITGGAGVSIAFDSTVRIEDCQIDVGIGAALEVDFSSHVQLYRSILSGPSRSILLCRGSSLSGWGNHLLANTPNVIVAGTNPGSTLDLQHSNIALSPSGYTVLLEGYDPYWNPAPIHLNLTNNFWGTTDPQLVAEEIWDGHDDPDMVGFVDFEPIREHSVPVSTRTFSSLKSFFKAKEAP